MRPELVLVGVTILWGSTFIVTKDIVREAPPMLYLVFRFGIAALVMLAIYWRQLRRQLHNRQLVVDGVVLGVLNSLGLVLQVLGQVFTTASKSAFITSLNTPLVPLVSFGLYRLRPSPPQLFAVVLATVGLMLLTYPAGGAHWNAGDLYTVGCAGFYAFTIVQIARRSPRHDARPLTAVQIATATLTFCCALALAKLCIRTISPASLPDFARLEARPLVWTTKLVVEGIYMAVACTVVTFGLQTWAMARMSATHAAIVFALEPVFATVMAIGWEGSAEWPGARGATGAAIVMIAVAVSEVPRRRGKLGA
jgi:drug/metabolite transporter (DMT)-like permease